MTASVNNHREASPYVSSSGVGPCISRGGGESENIYMKYNLDICEDNEGSDGDIEESESSCGPVDRNEDTLQEENDDDEKVSQCSVSSDSEEARSASEGNDEKREEEASNESNFERIAFWNARGLVKKLGIMLEWADRVGVSKIIVLDTQANGNINPSGPWKYFKGNENPPTNLGKGDRPRRGIGVLSKSPVEMIRVTKHNVWFIDPTRPKFMLHAGYWPNDRKGCKLAIDEFRDQVIEFDVDGVEILSVGDYNCRTKNFSDTVVNTNGKYLIDVSDQLQLYRQNEIPSIRETKGYSRIECRVGRDGRMVVQRSCPDGLMANMGAVGRIVRATVTDQAFGSDHYLVLLDLTTGERPKNEKRDESVGVSTWNMMNVSNFKPELNKAFRNFEFGGDVSKVAEDSISLFRSVAEKVLGRRERSGRPKRWISDRIKSANNRLIRAERKLRKSDNQKNRKKAAKCRRVLNRILSEKAFKSENANKQQIEMLQSSKQSKEMWERLIRLKNGVPKPVLPEYMKDESGVKRFGLVGVCNTLSEQFEHVSKSVPGVGSFMYDEEFRLQTERELAHFELLNNVDGPMDELWEVAEYVVVLKKMQNGKAAGPYEITPELIKEANLDMMLEDDINDPETDFGNHMMLLYDRCLEESQYPDPFRDGIIRALHKGGPKWKPKNYRPITLLCYLAKNFGAMIASRLLEWAEGGGHLEEEQGGFRKARSASQQLVTLYSIIKTRQLHGQDTIVCFLDVTKAYDTVWRTGLLVKLMRMGVTGNLWGTLKSMLSEMRRKMKTDGKCPPNKIKTFQPEEGLPQGAPESPILYSLYLNDLITKLKKEGFGVVFRGKLTPGLWFADDIALICDSIQELKRGLQIVSNYAKKWRFVFNGGKSAVVAFGSKNFRNEVASGKYYCTNSEVPVQSEYKYLGLIFQHNLRWNKHIEKILNKTTVASAQMQWLVKRGRGMRPRSAMLLWTATVRPVLEYGCELWSHTATAEQVRQIEAVQVKFLKKILGLPNGTASVFVRVENGVERMRARWDKLTVGFLKRALAAEPDRLCRKAVSALFQTRSSSASSWGSKVVTMLNSALNQSVAAIPDEEPNVSELVKECEFDIDRRESELSQMEARSMRSLRGGMLAMKNWGKINQAYAFAKTHVGRLGVRFPENYLDEWATDKQGVRLKLMARSGQLTVSARVASRDGAGGRAAECSCCNNRQPETMSHYMLQCPAFENEREKMVSKVCESLDALSRTAPPGDRVSAGDFMSSSEPEKIRLLLGRQTGNPITDKRIDRACRRFLRTSWKRRKKLRVDITAS